MLSFNNYNNNSLCVKFRKMEISEEGVSSNSEEQVEPVLSLSTLLSNILGNDDFESDIFDEGSNKSVSGLDDELENNFNLSQSGSYGSNCNENQNYFQNYQTPTGTFLTNKDAYQWNPNGTCHPLEEFVDRGLIDTDVKQPSWDPSYNINNNNNNNKNFNNSNVEMCSSVIPYADTIVPAYNCDTFCEGNLSSPEGVVLPWSPSNAYDCHRTSYQPYQPFDPVHENLGGRFVAPPPSFESKRLERVVSIKFGNNDGTQRKNPPILPIELPEYPNRVSRYPTNGHLKNSSQCSRVWGLTVEQWQTQQTTYRYFPTNCDQPAYWHDYNSLEMPSSRESSSPPIPDPSGNQGTSEISSSSEGIARTTASGGDDGGGESSESILSKSSVSKRIDGKRCGVCGDRALGYNFNAITCESCKAFFRRNALKNKEYRCPFNDECEVTAVTRRFCQRCRLRKCFEVGMKKEWIMTEEEKKTKRKKIMENRAKKGGEGDPTSSGGTLAAPPYLSGENKFENMNTISEQRMGIDAMADEIRSALIPTAENPLGLKPTGLNQKPKAVVVGRVRVEENDNKVRKIGLESDVHSQKQSTTESSTSIELEVPNPQVFSSHIGVSSNLFDLPPQPHFHPAATLSSSLPSTHLHHQSSTHSPSEGLVAGLLRTQSRGSAESDLSTLSQASLGCLAENLNSEALVMVKKEVEDPPFCESKMLEESDNSNSIDINAGGQFTFSILGESAAIFCQNSTTNLLPNTSSVKEETKKNFEFSIQDALNMIQPGCKDLSNDSKKFSGTNVMDSILNTAISAEYSAFSLLMNSHSSELNQAENIKITELLEASKGLNSPLCEEPNYKDLPNPSLINVINLTEIAIRRLIKMAKKISAFKSFCQEDQIALLKGGCAEMMILRSVSAYDPDKEVWKIQQDHERFKNIKLKVLKAASGNVYEEHKRFILSFNSEWRQDARIMALLAAVALFTPERPNVIHPQAVRHEQSSYLYLLKRYMECKYGGCLGKTNYLKLLEIISNLHTLNEEHVKVFLEVNPQEVEPLLIEIFDLKQS